MSRKQHTVVTISIRMTLPKGSNVAALTNYIGSAIATFGGGLDPEDPHFGITRESFTVNLVKKETTYV